jgi:membrane fusion protein (multidrug efflux system)
MKAASFINGFILPALLLPFLLVSCNHEEHHEVHENFAVTKPWKQKVTLERNFVAQIRAIQHIEIRAFEKGYLTGTFVNEGQLIKQGEKMFQIMPLLLKAKFEKEKAEYEVARIEFTNTEKLEKQKVVSKNELAMVRARFGKAKAELDLAEAHLNLATITAPFDGIMDRFRVRLGSLVEEGELLSTLSDISNLWVYFNVSESDYLNFMAMKKKNDEKISVQLLLANGKIYEHKGYIDTIEADFDNETGNVAFRATFPNPDLLLRHGETGNVVLTEEIDEALVIPQKATFEVLDKKFVYVVDNKGAVQQREIEISKEVPHLFVVKSGITESDTILLEGLGKVNKGQVIKTKFVTVPDVMKGLELAAN